MWKGRRRRVCLQKFAINVYPIPFFLPSYLVFLYRDVVVNGWKSDFSSIIERDSSQLKTFYLLCLTANSSTYLISLHKLPQKRKSEIINEIVSITFIPFLKKSFSGFCLYLWRQGNVIQFYFYLVWYHCNIYVSADTGNISAAIFPNTCVKWRITTYLFDNVMLPSQTWRKWEILLGLGDAQALKLRAKLNLEYFAILCKLPLDCYFQFDWWFLRVKFKQIFIVMKITYCSY